MSCKSPQHFLGAIGEKVKVKIVNERNQNETVNGILQLANDEFAIVKQSNTKQKKIKYDQIKKALTVFKWKSKTGA